MSVMTNLLNYIKTTTVNGNFYGSWFLEGTEEELALFNKNMASRLRRRGIKTARYDCIRSLRWPSSVAVLQLGEPARKNAHCYLLSIEIGYQRGVPFGTVKSR